MAPNVTIRRQVSTYKEAKKREWEEKAAGPPALRKKARGGGNG